ncbi:hypothetical protein EUX98_g5716 [Antrodiella citrinella]|uniref:Protein kinase domain-containing protein n=1 Tax=Antrodiella citrinella TaxID=2447956 RepID=A0A4S4MTH8_9APHY|nr:hypothetical protein EUX98_g5716 [Antrodiella citrinella]
MLSSGQASSDVRLLDLVHAVALTGDQDAIQQLTDIQIEDAEDALSLITKSRNRLLKILIKSAQKYVVIPTVMLEGVRCSSSEIVYRGAFADIFRGTYKNMDVAIKSPRIFQSTTNEEFDATKKQFIREVGLWKALDHRHVLPLLGASADALKNRPMCMVMPWMRQGTIRDRVHTGQRQGGIADVHHIESVSEWIAAGLEYIHSKGIVHGDLHGGNILIDDDYMMRITDLGMSVIAEATPHNYASIHGGGNQHFTAPELFSPEDFGMSEARPTYATDVYAFACLCVEMSC